MSLSLDWLKRECERQFQAPRCAPSLAHRAFVSIQKLDPLWALLGSDRATKATLLKPLPPVEFSHIVGEREGALSFSQCLPVPPLLTFPPPILGFSLQPCVTGLRATAAGRSWQQRESLMDYSAAQRFPLIPLCVLPKPLTLSDKLLSRRLPGPGRKASTAGGH